MFRFSVPVFGYAPASGYAPDIRFPDFEYAPEKEKEDGPGNRNPELRPEPEPKTGTEIPEPKTDRLQK